MIIRTIPAAGYQIVCNRLHASCAPAANRLQLANIPDWPMLAAFA